MQNSKLLLLFKTLEPSDLRSLSKFVRSPFFNKKEEVIGLFEFLKKQHKLNFPDKNLKKAFVFARTLPNIPFSEKRLKYNMSELLNLLHRYISISTYEKDGIIPELNKMNYFSEHKLGNDYQRELRKATEKVAKLSVSDEKYRQAYLLERTKDHNAQQIGIRDNNPYLQNTMDSFDKYFFLKKLRYLCQMLDQETILTSTFRKFMIVEMEQIILEGDYPKEPLIAVYRSLFLLLRGHGEHYFDSFTKEVNLVLPTLKNDEARLLFYFGINFCIRKIRTGDNQYANNLMDYYAKGVEGGYLLTNSEISPWTFKNMVQLGIGLKRFQWLEGFIEAYHKLLPAEHIEGAYHYNLAELHYAKGNIDEAYKHLNLSEFTNIQYNTGAKILLLRMYYEEGEETALFSLLSSFEIYLRRNKLLSTIAKTQYLNFVKVLFQIAKHGSSRKASIQKRLNAHKVVAARRWLQQRIDLL